MTKDTHSVSIGMMLSGMIVVLSGCHMGIGIDKTSLDNSHFMNSWATYTHCLNSIDPDTTQFDAEKLRELSKNVPTKSTWDIPLSGHIAGLISQPTDRFAVDVNAMTASCTLHSGKTAVARGHNDLARELFRRVIFEHSHPSYSYYTLQARAHLTKLDMELQALLR